MTDAEPELEHEAHYLAYLAALPDLRYDAEIIVARGPHVDRVAIEAQLRP